MSLKQRITNFENWISSNFQNEEPKYFQKELLKLFNENKDAFFYYRNWLYKHLLRDEENKSLNEFYSFLDEKSSLSKHITLTKHYLDNNSSEIFSQKRLNAFEFVTQNSANESIHNLCFLYQQYYEIEILFIVLSSFVKLNEDEIIETEFNNFKDSQSNLKKGVIINYLKSKLEKYPLIHKLFDLAYNPKIRNTIGHNNYKINNTKDRVSSIDGKINISKDELFIAIYSMQNLNNYLLNYLSNKSINTNNLGNSGILGIAFGFEDDNPIMEIYQLSCFFKFEEFKWNEKILFNIRQNEIETSFGAQSKIIGTFPKELKIWLKKLSQLEHLRVYLSPIIPRNEETEYISLDVGDFIRLEEYRYFDKKFKIKQYVT